jgi:ubiquinone/menaquinone biosynthesis C-methylase UbiE
MEPMVDEFERVAAEVTYAAPRIGLVSNVSGTLARGEEMAQAAYWRRHIRQPVRFSESMGWLCGQGYRMFMELGPSPVLLGMAARCFPEESGCVCLPSLKRGEGDCQRMLTSLAELYARGAAVDWDGFHRDRPHRRCALPTYPFQRERYWMESPTATLRSGSPDPGLVWRSTVEAGRRQSEQGPLDLRPESYAERWNCLERLTISLTAQTLLHLGIFKKANESFSVDEILQRCSIRPTYRHLLHRWLARLVDSDVLRIEGARFSNPHPVDLWPVKSQMETAREAFSDQPRFIEYIERCGNMLAEVLTGSQPALETLFPDGSSELAEWLYSEFSVSRYVSSIAASAVSALANAQAEHAPLRILEIGAGTGGTTGAVLRSLPPQTSEYWFTDMSEFFFDRAKERFAEFSSIRYGLLDIEQPPQGQGFAANSFHAVVATNVLHATRNLNTTLDHVQQLLTSGGVLVLSEVTRELAWYDITTGLIEGWQKFEDGWRSDSPILPVAKWMELLKRRGFEEVEVLPQKSSVAEVLGQHVIIARAPVKEQSAGMIPSAVSRPSTNSPQGDGADTDSERPSGRGSDEAVRKVLDSPADERRANLLDFVLLQVVRVLRMGPNHRPNRRSRLMDLGIDSLMALELRNRLGKALELPNRLPASLIFDYPTPESIALFLEQELIMAGVWGRSEEPPPAETAEPTGRSAEEIARLSDEQVEQMIMERLKKKQKEADI